MNKILLGVNIDHIATLRESRGVDYPCVLEAGRIVEKVGVNGITIHLREDRRHIQEKDLDDLTKYLNTKINLEMATTPEMLEIAKKYQPKDCCLVPEKREELTTEGGLDIAGNIDKMRDFVAELSEFGIRVSPFIDANKKQIDAAKEIKVPFIELHTGHYANLTGKAQLEELENIQYMATYATSLGLKVNAGHGLTLGNTKKIAEIPEIIELNIGHSIISRAVFVGLEQAIIEMKNLIEQSRLEEIKK
ncbi:Pyridoxine 5'-phosphate synthase [hydrothermal vent metagenome]|uniref:Pyridoxine 5'-phosphate synthase n=1 Tax=hydrothermal vent metagenome TaxID=652676 RepID=A0A1W1CQL8_9ZZZZ